jgi:hypothetical protein
MFKAINEPTTESPAPRPATPQRPATPVQEITTDDIPVIDVSNEISNDILDDEIEFEEL